MNLGPRKCIKPKVNVTAAPKFAKLPDPTYYSNSGTT